MKLYTADAIKEQVHKLLCQDCGETDYCPKCDYRELIDQILDVPTIDAEPVKHGHWDDMGDFEQCSVCHGTHLKEYQTYYGKCLWVKTDYCPHCGAKMDERKENE